MLKQWDMSRRVVLRSVLLMGAALLSACGDDESQRSPAVEPAWLAHVPADTAYVFGNSRPFPAAALDKMLQIYNESLVLNRKTLASTRTQFDDDAMPLPWLDLAEAVLAELDGKMSRNGLTELGLRTDGRALVYGRPFLPSGRQEIADRGEVMALLERIEQRIGATAERGNYAEIEYLRVHFDAFNLLIGVTEQELVWAVVPAADEALHLPFLFGDERPVDSLAANDVFDGMLRAHDFPGYGDGYFDLKRLVKGVMALELGDGMPDAASRRACEPFVDNLLSGMPRLVMGTTAADEKRYAMRVIGEVSASVGQALASITYPVPGVGRDTEALFALGVGIDVPQLRGALRRLLKYVADAGADCAWVDAAVVNQAVPQLDVALGPITAMFKGVYVELMNVELDPQQPQPTRVDARALAAVDDPGGLLAFAGLASPALAQLDVPADGIPVAVPRAALPPGVPALHVAIKDRTLVMAAGENGKVAALELLSAVPAAPAPLLSLAYNFEGLTKLAQAGSDQIAAAAAARDDSDPDEVKAAIDDLIALYSAYKSMALTVWADERGVVMDQELQFK